MTALKDTRPGTAPVLERVQPVIKEVHVQRQSNALKRSQELLHVLPTADILGLTIDIDPDVFSPAFYSETAFFTEQVIKHLKPGDKYLDMGCGAGATTVCAAALAGAEVTALDINPAAVANTRRNVTAYGVEARVKVLQSDVYDALNPDERFDTIYWNTPFGYVDEGTELTVYERAVFDPGYTGTKRFILGAKDHLKPDGQVLIGFSSTLGNQAVLEALAEEAGLKLELIAKEREKDNPHEVFLEFYRGIFLPSS